jgi:hypothetical protein
MDPDHNFRAGGHATGYSGIHSGRQLGGQPSCTNNFQSELKMSSKRLLSLVLQVVGIVSSSKSQIPQSLQRRGSTLSKRKEADIGEENLMKARVTARTTGSSNGGKTGDMTGRETKKINEGFAQQASSEPNAWGQAFTRRPVIDG